MKLVTILKNNKVTSGLVAMCLVFTVNCVSTMGMTSSTTPLDGKSYEVVGKAEGESNYSWALLGLWGFGNPDMDIAIKNAVTKKKGDAMINVRWYNKTYYFILFSLDKVYVEGDIVKFTEEKKRGKGRR